MTRPLFQWQSMPPLLFYLPVVPKVVGLCLKHRVGPGVIARANPKFRYGGLPFDSKAEMHQGFSGVLPYALLSNSDSFDERLQLAQQFIEIQGFPVILKPDSGHRGVGIQKISTLNVLKDALKLQTWDLLIQAFDDSDCEYGVFYMRQPGDSEGTIISITEKLRPVVVGDGKTTLQDLVHLHYPDSSASYIETLEVDPHMVLPKGKPYYLTVMASHCRGTTFRDLTAKTTPELTRAIQQICDPHEFYFGRLDVKTTSMDAFQKGQFNVIEINGATSEFTHIYDDGYSGKEAVQELYRQWHLLFTISLANPKESALSFRQFISKYLRFFWKTKQATGSWW